MAEQWPFKPFVEGSSPPALTKKDLLYRRAFLFVVRPHRRDVIRVLALTGKSFFAEGLFCLLCVPTGGMLFESPALTGKSFFTEGLFVCYASPHSSPRTDGYKAFSKIPCNSPSVKGIGFPL